MYSQSGGKGGTHAWLSDSTNVGALSYLAVQTYEYAYHCNFWTVHQRNAVLHVGTYALLPSHWFLCTLTAIPTLSQDGRTLTLDDTQLKIFNELQGKLQDILKAIKGIVAARKKGWGTGTACNADEMDAEWFCLQFCTYSLLSVHHLSDLEAKLLILSLRLIRTKLDFLEAWLANPNKFGLFSGLIGQSEQIWGFFMPDWPVQTNLVFFEAWCAIWINFDFLNGCLLQSKHIQGNFWKFVHT